MRQVLLSLETDQFPNVFRSTTSSVLNAHKANNGVKGRSDG